MIRIVKSMLTIVAVAAIATGATGAYFSDTATITDNTFSTGTLEIRVNSQPTVTGASFGPAAPGDVYTSDWYSVNNYGLPWFGGPSNLSAKSLTVAIRDLTDDSADHMLRKTARIRIEISRTSGTTWETAYENRIHMLPYHGAQDILSPVGYAELIPGSSVDFRYVIWLPESGTDQSHLMGKTLNWDFVFEGRTS